MKEFTVIFHSVVQIAQFVNTVNRYPFHVWLIRGAARLDAKSLLSLCSLELHAPVGFFHEKVSQSLERRFVGFVEPSNQRSFAFRKN